MKYQTNDVAIESESVALEEDTHTRSLWTLGWQRLKRDKVGYISLIIVIFIYYYPSPDG
ncbi:hypothetical protein P4S72_30165 [Vibrio sp. PP-XX7]